MGGILECGGVGGSYIHIGFGGVRSKSDAKKKLSTKKDDGRREKGVGR